MTQYCREVDDLLRASYRLNFLEARAPLHFCEGSSTPLHFREPEIFRMKTQILTIPAHSNGYALLQPAVLASVPVDAQDGALLVLGARPVLDLLLDAAPEEALRRTVFLNTIVTVTA